MGLVGTETKSLRKAYGETLAEIGADNKNIVVLDADLSSSTQTKIFAKQFPNRFFNCGIAEQDMIATAAGLASQGKIPFVSTFAMFATGRTYDQIRNSVCYPKFNVKIVATHGGVTVGEDGASHQALEDVALMRNLPNMTVVVPSDYKEVQEVIKYAATYNGPMYIRLPRTNLPDIFDSSYKFELQPKEIVKGTDLTIITNGETLKEVLQVEETFSKQGLQVQVIHCPVVKPTPQNLLDIITSNKVVTVENHSIIGGLGSMVAELIAESSKTIQLKRIGVNDKFGQSGTANELLDFYGLSKTKISEFITSKILVK
jgi:transketolase